MKMSFRIRLEDAEGLIPAIQSGTSNKKLKPGEYRISIETVSPERTTEQNRFYWSILNDIANEYGNEAEELHETFKARFLQDHSGPMVRIKSTTELSVREFLQYIDKILAYMANDFGWIMPTTREF